MGSQGGENPPGSPGGGLRGKSGGKVKRERLLPPEEMSGLAGPSARVAPTGKSGGGLPGEHRGEIRGKSGGKAKGNSVCVQGSVWARVGVPGGVNPPGRPGVTARGNTGAK